MEKQNQVVSGTCANLRQGHVVLLSQELLPSAVSEIYQGDCPAVVVSQTCDIVQKSKSYLSLAPILLDISEGDRKNAAKGRQPLILYFQDAERKTEFLANMENIFFLEKARLDGCEILATLSDTETDPAARGFAARVAQVFLRFPFPDDVFPRFRKLRDEVQKKTGKQGNFSRVLDYVSEIRVSCMDWNATPREITVFFIVASEYLGVTAETGQDQVNSEFEGMNLDSLSRRILESIDRRESDTVRQELWACFGMLIEQRYLQPDTDDGNQDEIVVEIISEAEMTVEEYRRTESLDLEALSHM
jgi:hypothetical protein